MNKLGNQRYLIVAAVCAVFIPAFLELTAPAPYRLLPELLGAEIYHNLPMIVPIVWYEIPYFGLIGILFLFIHIYKSKHMGLLNAISVIVLGGWCGVCAIRIPILVFIWIVILLFVVILKRRRLIKESSSRS